MTDVVIEVSVPQSTDIEIVADPVDVVADPNGPQVIIVAAPGPPGPPGSPGDGTGVVNETPSGVQDGVNTAFVLAHTPQVGSISVYRNGLRERINVGYTASGSDITFSTAPLSSDEITVDYLMEG